MIKGVSGSSGESADFIKKARGWLHENVGGEESGQKSDFGKTVAVGAGLGAAVGGIGGMAKAALDGDKVEISKTEVKHPIMKDKLEGYDQHADPMQDGKWSLKFTPTVRQEQVGEYTTTDVHTTSQMGVFLTGVVGMTIGAIGGGIIAAGIKVLRDFILNRE
jgi:hypothetical protein